MQTRYFDRGAIFDFSSWRALFKGMLSTGVYYGFDLSVDSTGNLKVGANHSSTNRGLLVLPTGIAVAEDNGFVLDFDDTGGAEDFTVAIRHTDNSLINGSAATYYITSGILTSQPTDGAILGWIRFDGTSLKAGQITEAPKQRSDLLLPTNLSRIAVEAHPPDPVLSLVTGAQAAFGVDTSVTPAVAWRGVENSTTAGTLVSTGYFQWRVLTEPWSIKLKTLIPTGAYLDVAVLDTAGTSVATTTISSSASWQDTTLAVPKGVGSWTADGIGTVKLTYNTPQGTAIKIARLVVDNWAFGISQI